VVAIQHGRAIFNLSASFHVPEVGPEHQYAMPDAPDPETLPTMREHLEPYADQFPPAFVDWIRRERPIDTRSSELPRWLNPMPSAREPEQLVWFRANGTLPDDALLHSCIVAYASDLTLLDTAVMAHANSWDDDRFMIASLDHAMWFHRDFRMDDWLLYVLDSPSAGGARGLCRGSLFTRDGRLVASTAQEGMLRVLPEGSPLSSAGGAAPI
jgi:acyl-CoA thioesterase-2